MLPLGSPDRIHVAHSMITVWWPMPDCSCRSPWPTIWVWVSWWTATLTWEMRRVEPTRGTSC